jgi:hypothetical protein
MTGTAVPGTATLPFESILRHVVVKVSVNRSRPLPFILDTGDKLAIVDLDRARELGLSLQGAVQTGGAGSATLAGAFVEGASFSIPGLEGFSHPVPLAFPLQILARGLGQDIDGIFGNDFLQEFVAELDYHSGVLRLHDKAGFRYSGPGESIPVELNPDGHPVVDATVTPPDGEPLPGRFMLDIGSAASLALHSPFVAEHHLLSANRRTIRAIGAAGVGGRMSGRLGRMKELRVGTFRLADPITFFSQDTAGAFANTAIQGNLGEQILRRFTVFLDYGRGRVILEPSPSFGQPFTVAFSGVALVAEGADYRTFRIIDVLEDSPASEAGLLPGDRISALDGRPAREWSLSELARTLERPVSYRVDVQRDDTRLQVDLRPRPLV